MSLGYQCLVVQTIYILFQSGCIILECKLGDGITNLSDEPGDGTCVLKSCEREMGRVGQCISDWRISKIRPQPIRHSAGRVEAKAGEAPVSLPWN